MVRSSLLLLTCSLAVGVTVDWTAAESLSRPQRPKVAVVLSGGGARGGAHIGALRQLEMAGIPMDLIVGTSIGALVGGLYAVGYSADDIEWIVNSLDWNALLDDAPERRQMDYDGKQEVGRNLLQLELVDGLPVLPAGFSEGQRIRQLLDRLTAFPVLEAGNDFDRFPIPFRAVATDLLNGKAHIFEKGSLSLALRASMAVPGLFTPVDLETTLLVDGGIANNLPVDVARDLGADVVIAVDVSTPIRNRKEEIRSLLDVLDQTISIHIEENKARSRALADVVITPDLQGVNSGEFGRLAELVRPGEEAVEVRLEDVRKALARHSLSPGEPVLRADRIQRRDASTMRSDLGEERAVPEVVRADGLKDTSRVERFFSEPGEPVSPEGMDRQVSRLFGTNQFDTVGYRLYQDRGRTVLTYELDPSPSTTIGLGIRYDLDYEFTGAVEVTSRKFPIPGSEWRFRGLAGNANGALFQLDSSPIAGESFLLSSGVYYRSHMRQRFEGSTLLDPVEDERGGFSIGAGFLFGNQGKLEGTYRLERLSGIEDVGDKDIRRQTLSGLELSFGLDTRDDAYFPQRGSFLKSGIELQDEGLGSDASFRRFSSDLEHVIRLGAKTSLALEGSWGIVDGDEIPYLEKFFTGGAHYLSFSAAPFAGLERDRQASLHRLIAGLTLRHRVKTIPLGFIQAIYVGGKYQAGLFNEGENLTEFYPLLHGAGLGVYLDSALIGPFSFELGGTNEKDFSLYFSVGHRF